MGRCLAILCVLLAIAASCASGDDGDSTEENDGAVPASSEDLVGVLWTVTGFVDGASIDPASEAGQVKFERNGYVSGSDGCNGFGFVVSDGPADPADGLVYKVMGDEIHFEGSPLSTLIGCSDNEYEGRVRHVLTGVVKYELSGTQLRLLAADGSGVVLTSNSRTSP